MGGRVTPEQEAALEVLSRALGGDAYLVGGVAVASRLHHRTSRDLDVFTSEDPSARTDALLALSGVRLLARSEGSLQLEILGVPVSVLRYGYPLLAPPERAQGLAVPVASFEDLVAMKLSAIAGRGTKRDFWDLHLLLESEKLELAQALELFERKFVDSDRGHVVRALAYFGDAEREPMPLGLDATTWSAIQAAFRARVRGLDAS